MVKYAYHYASIELILRSFLFVTLIIYFEIAERWDIFF